MPSSLFRTATCAGALAGLLFVAAPTVSHAQTTIAVTNCNDSGAGSLRAAVASAASGDIIAMTGLGCGRIELTSGPIAIPQNALSLRGPGHWALVIDGNYRGSVLRHSGSGTLRINRLAIEYGKHLAPTTAEGGCIYSAGNLDIRYSHVRHCVARAQGGNPTYAYGAGVYAAGTAYVSRSRIHSSIAHGSQTAGGGVFTRGHLTIDRSGIVNNTAHQGGGLYAEGGLAANYISVSGNFARRRGGGIAAQGEASIANSAIGNNRTDGLAGGVEVWGSGAQLIVNSTVSGNQAAYCYSAVLMRGTDSTIANSTIAFNDLRQDTCQAYPRTAGAVRAVGTLHLQSTIVANNAGNYYQVGGVVRTDTLEGDNNLIESSRLEMPPGTLTFDPVLAQLADNGGGRMTHALVEGSPAIDHGNNTAGLTYDQRGAGHRRVLGPQADIGAFEGSVPPSTIAVTNCNDAGVGSLRDAVARATTRDTIDMRTLTCGMITLTTGAIEIPQDDLMLKGPGYDQLTISGNNASQVFRHSGTGLSNAGTLQIHDLTMAHGLTHDVYGDVTGGCISSRGSVDVTNSQIHHCVAQSTAGRGRGGGIFASGHVTLTSSAVFTNAAHAPHDHPSANGGGIHTDGGLTLDRSILCDNVADGFAGGAHAIRLTMDQSLVCRNTADMVAALSVPVGPTSITRSTISGNRGLNGHGVVATNGSVTIANSTFSNNTAVHSSALSLHKGSVRNSTFAFNQESGPPSLCNGALYVNGLVHLQSNIVAHNTCSGTPADLVGGSGSPRVDGANNLIMSSSLRTPPDTLTSDPRLAPLADNGGRTRTHALLDGSPAIDAGNNVFGFLYDQRGPGFPRVKGPQADIGAYER